MRFLTSPVTARLSPAALLPFLLLVSGCSRYNSYGNTRFIWIVILALDIFAMIDIFRQNWDIGKKILWLVILYFLPFIGLILYYTISGRNKPVA